MFVMMKRIFPVLLLVVLFSSCLNTQSHYTPQVSMSTFTSSSGDSLTYRFDELSGLYNVDSVHVGDTLTAAVGFASLGNNLISAHIKWDTAYMNVRAIFSEQITNLLLPQSDTVALDLYCPTGYNYLGLPIVVVPKKAGSTPLKFTVVSDSKYSPTEEVLIMNIVSR